MHNSHSLSPQKTETKHLASDEKDYEEIGAESLEGEGEGEEGEEY